MIRVLLVDGVGNAVIYENDHPWPPSMLTVGDHQFIRTREEKFDSLTVYRLRGFMDEPAIRHINLALAKEEQ
jgi:hypothetical protein